MDTPTPRDDSASAADAADAATSGDAVCPDAAAADAAADAAAPTSAAATPEHGRFVSNPAEPANADADDPAEAMEMEDPFEREEGASTPIPPPPRNVILSDTLDAADTADAQGSADPADLHTADAAHSNAPTSPGLFDLVDEDLLLLSDDDPEQRAKGK